MPHNGTTTRKRIKGQTATGLLRTDKTSFTPKRILEAIEGYESTHVPAFDELWRYFTAKDPTILQRDAPDANNPDNKTVVPYGRKLVKTFQGYGYRPGFITYKSENEAYLDTLKDTFSLNNEIVKTSRTGRDTGIYGEAYELLYIEGITTGEAALPTKAQPRFINVDPRQIIVFYDFAPEPAIVIAIRFYWVNDDLFKVEVMEAKTITFYDREKTSGTTWKLTETEQHQNHYGEPPVVAYYLGDETIGIIEPVTTLIDDYDLIMSDSMNEFDKFANAYLLIKGMLLTNPNKKEARSFSRTLRDLKRRRVIEGLRDITDVQFLLKDTPHDFIEWLSNQVRDEIHKQSHVPDFMSEKLGGDVSGVAVARMMFDFENLVSSAQGDFDISLHNRIRLMTKIYDLTSHNTDGGESKDITITHKRNVPEDVAEFAKTALVMAQAGFSKKLAAEVMPNDIIPNVAKEIDQQLKERTDMFGEGIGEIAEDVIDTGVVAVTDDVQKQALNGAQIASMVEIIQGVSQGTVAADSAIALLLVAIPSLTEQQAKDIIDPAAANRALPQVD